MNRIYCEFSSEQLVQLLKSYTVESDEYRDILSVLNTRGWRVL